MSVRDGNGNGRAGKPRDAVRLAAVFAAAQVGRQFFRRIIGGN